MVELLIALPLALVAIVIVRRDLARLAPPGRHPCRPETWQERPSSPEGPQDRPDQQRPSVTPPAVSDEYSGLRSLGIEPIATLDDLHRWQRGPR